MQDLSAAARWAEFDSCLAKLVTAANSMRQLCYAEDNNYSNTSSMRDCLIAPDAPLEAHSARDTVVAALSKLHMHIAGPSELLSQLAMHVGILTHLCPFRKTTVASDTDIGSILKNQMLACLHWLGEFQILAFIPHQRSIALGDIAELASVPENQLRRIVRMMTAAGFLHEPQPGQVEHTALSAPFGNRPSYHDALMFLTSSAAPAAMQMVPVTQRWRHQQLRLQGIACHSNDLPLAASIRQQAATPRRQWPSYLRYALRDQDSSLASIFNSFDWATLGNATIVDVGARSTTMASALAECYPSLKLVVQLSTSPDPDPAPTELDSRIVVQSRPWAMPQTVRDAAVYALRVPYDFPVVSASAQTRPARLRAELEAHLGVLRENDAARLIFTTRLLPCHSDAADDKQSNDLQPGLDAAKGLVFDMSLLQLADDRELEVADLRELVGSVGDGNGHLVLEDKLQVHSASRDRAFEVRFHRMP